MSILVTGATSGIGRETAKILAARGESLILVGREPERLRSSVEEARRAAPTGKPDIRGLHMDLASLDSVRQGASTVKEHGAFLKGIVLCAGVNTTRLEVSADGFETTFAVNVLSPYLLLHLLLESVNRPARVIIVASGTHDPATLDGRPAPPAWAPASRLADPSTAPSRGQVRYSTSKLADVMLAYEFSRRLHEAGLSDASHPMTVNAFDPGAVPGTGLTREWSRSARIGVRALRLLRFLPLNIHSVSRSATALADLMTAPGLRGVSGRYFGVSGEKSSSRASYDQRNGVDLFRQCAQLVSLDSAESPLCVAGDGASEVRAFSPNPRNLPSTDVG